MPQEADNTFGENHLKRKRDFGESFGESFGENGPDAQEASDSAQELEPELEPSAQEAERITQGTVFFAQEMKLDIPSGNAYRKMNDRWNTDDFHEVGLSYERFRDSQIRWSKFVDEVTCRIQYKRWYLRK